MAKLGDDSFDEREMAEVVHESVFDSPSSSLDVLDVIAMADGAEETSFFGFVDSIVDKLTDFIHGSSESFEEELEMEGEGLLTKALAVLTFNKTKNKTAGMIKMGIYTLIVIGLGVVVAKVYPFLRDKLPTDRLRI